jgi:hypothetical protein
VTLTAPKTRTGERPTADTIRDHDTNEAIAAEALFKEARQRRRHRRRIAGVALLAVLVAAAIVISAVHTSSAPNPPVRTTAGIPRRGVTTVAMPSQMVVWAQTSPGTLSIQVISSKSGQVVRTLATDDGLFDGSPQPTVSGLGTGTVYYDNSVGGSAPPNPGPLPYEQILSVPLKGGVSTFVAYGHNPQVSPNGQYLAYLTYTQITNAPEAVVVKDLLTGATNIWQYATDGPVINTISWSPDSTSLVVSEETFNGTTSSNSTARTLVLSDPNRSLDALPLISLPQCPPPTPWAPPGANRDMAWAGFLNAKQGIGDCFHVGLTRQDTWTRPVVIDLATGHVVRKLPVISGLIGEGTGSAYQVDASGQYLEFIGSGSGAGGLYRWAVGGQHAGNQSHPVLVKSSVGAASWIPSNL